ncbi:erythromycin esterase family protein [Kutzneria sp. NPDC051319]|uniref:erythromycin esterase family protein n=1 Tax=Kutzneria sp. NPDC051319 TaxID=3155047 RepID=UPI00344664D1
MSTAAPLHGIGRQLDTPAALARTIDELLATRPEAPVVVALGEPTHGVKAFPLLRNDMLARLVERGFRSIALESDFFAGSVVDAYVNGGEGEIEEVLATGFSHGFGAVPGNRELVEWLRAHNAGRAEGERVRFYGFDAPTETGAAPSPRRWLVGVKDYLPAGLHPESSRELEGLLGDDGDWTNPAAMYDPGASIGDSDRVRALRIIADDLASALRRAAPSLLRGGYSEAVGWVRTAQALLRYHAAMARTAPDRVGVLMSLRTEMMADNLRAMVERERHRGPSLVFAHNMHLRRGQSTLVFGAEKATWGSAGALLARDLGERYVFVASDGSPSTEEGTLQGALASATEGRTLFPAEEARAALPEGMRTGEAMVRGHIPLTREDLDGADAVVFITDTDGKQHQYW